MTVTERKLAGEARSADEVIELARRSRPHCRALTTTAGTNRTPTGLAGYMWAHDNIADGPGAVSVCVGHAGTGVVGPRVDTRNESRPTPRRLSQSTCRRWSSYSVLMMRHLGFD
jgi:hypothetical protein